jgi:hypothetical protein
MTPKDAANYVHVQAKCNIFNDGGSAVYAVFALFQDDICIAASSLMVYSQCPHIMNIDYEGLVGVDISTVFTTRVGTVSEKIFTINGENNARRLGGVMATTLSVTELLP